MGFRESKNRPVATNFQFLKILALLGQLLVGACLPQTLLERVRQTGIVLLLVIEVDDKSTHYCNSNEQSKLNPIT